MPRAVRMTSNGIVCNLDGFVVNLDPKKTTSSGLNFISHAHTDHLPEKQNGVVLTSIETSKIAKLRGVIIQNFIESYDNLLLYDSGHILGSKGLLIDNVFYTGDICTRKRGFLQAATIPKCKTLITECTFGLPEFIFPSLDEIKIQVNEIISELYSKGIPVILLGYQLGKAQTISNLFGHWEPLYYHDSVKKMNDLHRHLGVELKDAIGHSQAESQGLLDKKPWIMIAPMMSQKSPFIKHMKDKYNAVTIGFSGWAKSSRVSFGRSSDYSIPLSDHCDFNELVELVKKTGAEKVYTIHGFVDEFASHLRKEGFDAQALREESLDDYI